MAKPIVAIVGRPNVGKSTLFNKLIGERRSIVEDTPGVTRDRIYGETEWRGKKLTVIDTGGIEPKADDIILSQMRVQAQLAIDTADVIIFMCDVRTGLTASDRDIAIMLKKSGKPIVPCINKCDRVGQPPMEFYEFYELGFDQEPIGVSSIHGSGSGDLLDACIDALGEWQEEETEDDSIHVAVIGKPNAGKSSIINKLIGENRLIVSNIAGTTRDAVDTQLENDLGSFTFIDTAGIRRQSKINDRIEHFSVLRAHMAVERAEVCLLLIDAETGITEQDEKIAGIAHEAGKAVIIVVNKWDLIEKGNNTMKEWIEFLKKRLAPFNDIPIVFTSVLEKQRILEVLKTAIRVHEARKRRIATSELNEYLLPLIENYPPPATKGKYIKIKYVTQLPTPTPQFAFFVNLPQYIREPYRRFLENNMREQWDFSGVPMQIYFRQK